MARQSFKSVVVAACAVLTGACTSVGPAPDNVSSLPPIRFLLTFDDGPSGSFSKNPTERIIDTLAHNDIQPGIKAVFFVQTRWPGAGGSAIGRRLLQRLAAESHVLGVHSGTERGHINHRIMSPVELYASIDQAKTDIREVGSEITGLVRPTYWSFDTSTLATYERAGVSMLLTDLRARDGNPRGWGQVHPESGGRLHRDFRFFLQRLASGRIPVVDGVAPVVVTFHDTNLFTAEKLSTYVATLLEVGRSAGIRIADPPFYSDHDSLLAAARARSGNNAARSDLAP